MYVLSQLGPVEARLHVDKHASLVEASGEPLLTALQVFGVRYGEYQRVTSHHLGPFLKLNVVDPSCFFGIAHRAMNQGLDTQLTEFVDDVRDVLFERQSEDADARIRE